MAMSGEAGDRPSSTISGINQTGLRAHNERLVLSLLRQYGTLSKAEIARHTGLSAQTISVINRALETEHLVFRGQPVRGRIGQPSVPMALNPDGAFSIGLRIGRRSADLVLMDFVGTLRAQVQVTYRYPTPERILAFVAAELDPLIAGAAARDREELRDRVIGIGVAAPFQLWNWLDRLGAPADEMAAWRDLDIVGALGKLTGLDIILENDASSACLAELSVGGGRRHKDFAYFYVGSFIGGGMVINHALQTGVRGNAGAFGSIPLPRTADDRSTQLIDRASLYLLERDLVAAGRDVSALWTRGADWSGFDEHLSVWYDDAAPSIASAIVSVAAVFDFPVVIIDGAFPTSVRHELTRRVRLAMAQTNTQGIAAPQIEEGQAGANARALGSALLPISTRFLLEPTAFLATN